MMGLGRIFQTKSSQGLALIYHSLQILEIDRVRDNFLTGSSNTGQIT